MRKFLLALLFSYTAFLISCKTIQGIPIAAEQKVGKVFVSSSIDGAKIFLDNKDTGKLTPAVLEEVAVGRHVVRIFLENHFSTPDSIVVNVEQNKQADVFFELQAVQIAGAVQVNTDPDSAQVFVDNTPRGYTPLIVTSLSPGQHSLKILKSNHLPQEMPIEIFQDSTINLEVNLTLVRSILVEHFSNSYCEPCVEADTLLENILHEEGSIKTVSLGYHPPIPSPLDPMYILAKTGNDARVNYYGVTNAPTVWLDGEVVLGGTFQFETRLRNGLAQRTNVAPGAIVEFFDFQVTSTAISGRVRVQALETLNNAALHIAFIEREVTYPSPPGTNGQTYFFDVFRGFYPSVNGTSINIAPGEKRFVNFNITPDPQWVLDQIQAIAFVQKQDNEVAQAAWTVYP